MNQIRMGPKSPRRASAVAVLVIGLVVYLSASTGATAAGTDSDNNFNDEVRCDARPPVFPAFDKSCETDQDCTFGLHQVNCCGGLRAVGFNLDELDRFRKAESLCQSQYPPCGCFDCRIITEDESAFCQGSGWKVLVRCQAGQCMTAAQAP
jgi:hypothetical protein